MDVLEFLERTNHRNLQLNIEYMVNQRLRERELELEKRRKKLREMLEFENEIYNQELAIIMRERHKAEEAKRQEWIGLMRLQRELEEEKMLAWKKKQRESENSEDERHTQSKQIEIETKQAQLRQIEAKNGHRLREKLIEQKWAESIQHINNQRDQRDGYENKLRKVIAGIDQQRNLKFEEEIRTKEKLAMESLRREHAMDNSSAAKIDVEHRDDEKRQEKLKRRHQRDILQQQIQEHQVALKMETDLKLSEDLSLIDKHSREMMLDLEREASEKIRNREWHKQYLEHTLNERKCKREQEKKFDDMLLGTGCVLQQELKTPYGKKVR